jgi:hypothetical protein
MVEALKLEWAVVFPEGVGAVVLDAWEAESVELAVGTTGLEEEKGMSESAHATRAKVGETMGEGGWGTGGRGG